ncbi:glycosyltransferase family 10 [Agrobacterium sp. lyk4-40-TYG-31]|uniref:glycosyltransferase family 10 domain-containing protein n=1 Tax=Agrobacterium sp. lyk4-40-TYG-31 TaxID=3040276 RepID=UPI00255035DD|nr:glycosyltransferase family 10 [Agrobacterium sp. lyk4-40-TYG-31]
MRAIIYDPQQKNMDNMFYEKGVNPEDNNVWHEIQTRFHAIGFELYTPNTYPGRLEDVSWVIFQNMPQSFKPTNLRRRFKRFIKRLTGDLTFYQKCVKAGLSQRISVILYEPEVVAEFSYDKNYHKLFSAIFTWDEELIRLGNRYKKFVYPQPNFIPLKNTVPFEERKLICNFSANKKSSHENELYSARIKTIKFFEENCLEDFDHYGRGWSTEYKSWRGSVEDKEKTMGNYRFNLCYENAINFRGYLTEKIFDSLISGCVPIYLGTPDIHNRVASEAFIDRSQFGSDAELLTFIKSVDQTQWQAYVDAGQAFLASKTYQKYTPNGIFKLLKSGLSLNH